MLIQDENVNKEDTDSFEYFEAPLEDRMIIINVNKEHNETDNLISPSSGTAFTR